uniref:Uncharacterized protein n=1 Tax=Oryza brachyantha TaxID=4533 RepID=J3L7F4_ORYBR
MLSMAQWLHSDRYLDHRSVHHQHLSIPTISIKSLPPRPKVVTAPDFQPCKNPVTIGIAGSRIQSPCSLFAIAG